MHHSTPKKVSTIAGWNAWEMFAPNPTPPAGMSTGKIFCAHPTSVGTAMLEGTATRYGRAYAAVVADGYTECELAFNDNALAGAWAHADAEAAASALAVVEGFVTASDMCSGMCAMDVALIARTLAESIVVATADARAWVCIQLCPFSFYPCIHVCMPFLCSPCGHNVSDLSLEPTHLHCHLRDRLSSRTTPCPMKVESKVSGGQSANIYKHILMRDVSRDSAKAYADVFAKLRVIRAGRHCSIDLGIGAQLGDSAVACVTMLAAMPILESAHTIAEAAAPIAAFACTRPPSSANAAVVASAATVTHVEVFARAIAESSVVCEATHDADACVFARSYAEAKAAAIAKAFATSVAAAVDRECSCDISGALHATNIANKIMAASVDLYAGVCSEQDAAAAVDVKVVAAKKAIAFAMASAVTEAIAAEGCTMRMTAGAQASAKAVAQPKRKGSGNKKQGWAFENAGEVYYAPKVHINKQRRESKKGRGNVKGRGKKKEQATKADKMGSSGKVPRQGVMGRR
jgi:hypothetical protein